ncbi:terpenoid cyclases/Protein prenyltransferase [Saitoella complicata NRRL Y-17804]|uniref:Protein farnesyltransferase subunit beta n=1 Tax=Saitoella complicata (strain BCRC 22490 / CBS 7301 / JCM 7358 / NBRC 10748 / NRRL Y-17804) TaxID=698492 RepID=A0A0E9NE11_SAICN|nr:terpenoid cyclases/Protein prenyltransferase [Saitoella complicata NRRL Y-17804]ODQ50681.1 terpenoid cyclases/Protein prenyltransferase [Saitoella complicata NRRL Y-17804]GAO47936.1 hypothetical protein G7K_2131-t1 [Saitoella complicata NRRL Y-17804]
MAVEITDGRIKDGLVTLTSEQQDETERACEPYLSLSQMPLLDRENHLDWLQGGLDELPDYMVMLDASRPWIMYWTLNAMALLGGDISIYRDRLISSLRSCQHPDGGFGGGDGQLAHLAPTYAAINALAIVGGEEAYEIVDRKAMYSWLMSLKQEDGSFLMLYGGENDSRAMYCALSIASLLNLTTPELTRGCAEWLSRCQTYEGGLAGVPGAEAHGGYAFCVLASLCLLGPPSEVLPKYLNFSNLVRWLSARQYSPEGGLSGRTNKLVDGCYSWWVGGCWALVEAAIPASKLQRPLWDRGELQKYILACCQHKNGGLRDKPEKWPDHYHSCYVLSGLSAAQYKYTYRGVGIGMDLGNAFAWAAEGTRKEDGIEVRKEDKVKMVHPVFVVPWGCAEQMRKWALANPIQ